MNKACQKEQDILRVLVTGGATCERIDDVRYITNVSSGKTAVNICEELIKCADEQKRFVEVFYLHGKYASIPNYIGKLGNIKSFSYTSFVDLNEMMRNMLGEIKFNAVIHLAAVSDYSVESVAIGSGAQEQLLAPNKLSKLSSQEEISLKLKRNFKIIERIREYDSSKQAMIVGFKLTDSENPTERKAAVARLLGSNKGVDYVVHNDLHDIGEKQHWATTYDAKMAEVERTKNKEELAKFLSNLVIKH